MIEYKKVNCKMDFTDKVVMVTGGANGIGRAIVDIFASQKANMVIVDIAKDVKDVAKSIEEAHNVKAIGIFADVSKKENIDNAVNITIEKFSKIDVLVNCAGVVFLDEAERLSEEKWDLTMSINLKAPFLFAQAVGCTMIENNGGKIINICSQAGKIALNKHVAYCTSKFGINGLTKVLAIEWAKYGINVNCVSPTVVLTELGKKAWSGKVGEDMIEKIPAGRFAYPDEVAGAVLFLASDLANMITGEDLVIDGGYTAQ